MPFSADNNNDNLPTFGRYSVLRKNFVRDILLATIFLLSFCGSFLITWDIWIVPSNYSSNVILYCIGISLLVAIVITVPINFIIKITQRAFQEAKRKKQLEKDKKDFLDQ